LGGSSVTALLADPGLEIRDLWPWRVIRARGGWTLVGRREVVAYSEEDMVMSKQVVGRAFFGSLAAFAGSLLLAGAAVLVAVDQDVSIMKAPTSSACGRAAGPGQL
jgi:hypothetical protein